MGIFGSVFKALNPAKQMAAIVDGVVRRIKDKYSISIVVVRGGFELQIDDRKPEDTESCLCEDEPCEIQD